MAIDIPEAPALWPGLVLFRPGVGDADQGLGGLAVLPQERREFLRRGRRRDHRLRVEELLELWLAEQRDEFAVEPRDDGRCRAAWRRQTPPTLAGKSLEPGLVQGRHVGQHGR